MLRIILCLMIAPVISFVPDSSGIFDCFSESHAKTSVLVAARDGVPCRRVGGGTR